MGIFFFLFLILHLDKMYVYTLITLLLLVYVAKEMPPPENQVLCCLLY